MPFASPIRPAVVEEEKPVKMPPDELEYALRRIAPPSDKAKMIAAGIKGMDDRHDKYCHLVCGGLDRNQAYLLAGYARCKDWQDNARKLFKSPRSVDKLARFRSGMYGVKADELTPEAIIRSMKELAAKATERGDFASAAKIYEKLGQQTHGMFLQPKKGTSQRDLGDMLSAATTEEIMEQLGRLAEGEVADDPAESSEETIQ